MVIFTAMIAARYNFDGVDVIIGSIFHYVHVIRVK